MPKDEKPMGMATKRVAAKAKKAKKAAKKTAKKR